jgi:hypothetical protein
MKMNLNSFKYRKQPLPITRVIPLAVGVLLLTSLVVTAAANEAISSLLSRSQQQQAFAQQASAEPGIGSVLKLARTNVPIDIPLQKGYENGNEIYFIATDASDEQTATYATNLTGFKVNYAPALAQTPDSARAEAYAFTNGVAGDGPSGFQLAVISGKPGDEEYSPLQVVNEVTWNDNATARELKSVQEITTAEQNGELTINNTNIVVNHPAIQWQNGSLMVREDAANITDDTPYMGGQVLRVDIENMIVTMVAHRGWGPDGKTIYYIVTDATPGMPANMMGVPHVPADEQLVGTAAAPSLFQFMNGINGSGPMGFQAGIGDSVPGDQSYSPMWFISFIEWSDPSQARVLETVSDVAAMQQAGLITVTPAMNGTHVVNCPFFDAETILEHKSQQFSQQL